MTRSIRFLLASAVLFSAGGTSWGQLNIQPTPAPLVTADGEAWFRAGEPIVYSGGFYYPAGALIHFLPGEMVRTGMYRGVPLYSRTTIEPFGVVFVPVSGGLMQPYERGIPAPLTARAAAPPVIGAPIIFDEPMRPAISEAPGPSQPAAARPVATTGVTRLPIRRGAANAIYMEFHNARWFSSGLPVALDVSTMTQVGDTHGFPVYAMGRGAATVYVPISQGSHSYAPYSRRK